jgi:hypothetical protein
MGKRRRTPPAMATIKVIELKDHITEYGATVEIAFLVEKAK